MEHLILSIGQVFTESSIITINIGLLITLMIALTWIVRTIIFTERRFNRLESTTESYRTEINQYKESMSNKFEEYRAYTDKENETIKVILKDLNKEIQDNIKELSARMSTLEDSIQAIGEKINIHIAIHKSQDKTVKK